VGPAENQNEAWVAPQTAAASPAAKPMSYFASKAWANCRRSPRHHRAGRRQSRKGNR